MYQSLAELETAMSAELTERGRFMRNAQPTAGRIHLLVIIDDGFVTGTRTYRQRRRAGLGHRARPQRPQTGLGRTPRTAAGGQDGDGGRESAAGVEQFAAADTVTVRRGRRLWRGRLARYRVATAAQIVSLDDEAARGDPG